jgi:hypothetical protein
MRLALPGVAGIGFEISAPYLIFEPEHDTRSGGLRVQPSAERQAKGCHVQA